MSSFKIRAAAIPAGLVLCAAVSAGSDFYYPPAGRNEAQQRQDKYECHEWAVVQSKFDPAEYASRQPTTAPATTTAAAAAPSNPDPQSQTGKSMVAGAATGALVGEAVNNDAGNGAIYGGAAGLIRGRMADKKASAEKAAAQQRTQQQQQQMQQQQAAATQDVRTKQQDYSRARSTCFKARGYTVSEG